jgi:hypothetical protein
MSIHRFILFASLFAIGCGKSDEERMDDLIAGCESLLESYRQLADECGLGDFIIDCQDLDSDCLDEAEASLECSQRIGYESLECNDDLEGALDACADEFTAYSACAGF